MWHGFRAQPDGEVEILGFFVDAMDQWSRKRDFADVPHKREKHAGESREVYVMNEPTRASNESNHL